MDEYISREAVINITAETGAWETQNRVRELPAADVQPVRRGKWIGDEVIQCSICNFTLNGNAFERIVRKYFKYCPNCGARMIKDGEIDE